MRFIIILVRKTLLFVRLEKQTVLLNALAYGTLYAWRTRKKLLSSPEDNPRHYAHYTDQYICYNISSVVYFIIFYSLFDKNLRVESLITELVVRTYGVAFVHIHNMKRIEIRHNKSLNSCLLCG